MNSTDIKNVDTHENHFELDSVAQFYAAAISDTCPGTFSISARLKENVNPEILQKAVNDLTRRLPFVNGQLQGRFFRQYIEILNSPPQIMPVKDIASFGRCHKKGRDSLLRVLYGAKHFTVETTHIVCDGRSLTKITTALLARYYELLGITAGKNEIIDFAGKMQPEEIENAFERHVADFNPKEVQNIFMRYSAAQKENKIKEAYHFGDSCPAVSRIVSKKCDAAKLKTAAKAHGATVSEFILAHIFIMIAEERKRHGSTKPIAVMLPVDYRTFFPSETLTNFAMGKVIHMPETDEFSAMLRQIKSQFEAIDANYVSDDIVGFTKILRLTKFIPLPIKKRLFKAMKRSASAGHTTTFSNLGLVKLPAEIEVHLEALEFAFCPDSEREPYVFSCVTVGNALVLTAAIATEGVDTADRLMEVLGKQ